MNSKNKQFETYRHISISLNGKAVPVPAAEQIFKVTVGKIQEHHFVIRSMHMYSKSIPVL